MTVHFRRLRRQGTTLGLLDLYARIDAGHGDDQITSGRRITAATESIRDHLVDATSVPSRLHGWRTQAVFEAIVATMGEVKLLKSEDWGEVFFSGPEISVPDYRIVTSAGAQLLVEVKNFHSANPTASFPLRRTDLEAWRRYAELVEVPDLRIAIYWSHWNLWTLIDDDAIARSEDPDSSRATISLPRAIQANSLNELGDRHIATEWPIGLRLFPREDAVVAEGRIDLTVDRAEYFVGDEAVKTGEEMALVHNLIAYGKWRETVEAEYEGGNLQSVSFSFAPEEPKPGQPFALHPPYSSILSSILNSRTLSEDGAVSELRVEVHPDSLRALLPIDHDGDVLRIWQFNVSPNER